MFPETILTTGAKKPLLPELIQAISYADEIRIACSFIQMSGMTLIKDALNESLNSGVKIHIVTSDYLDITDPEALRYLMVLSNKGAKIKIFETGNNVSFHVKAYIFTKFQDQQQFGCAYVGSSNLSKSALVEGFEWNLQIDSQSDGESFKQLLDEFESIVIDPRCDNLTHDWIDDYISRRRGDPSPQFEFEQAPIPNLFQTEALQKLKKARLGGITKGLVVLATGLGKTWLSAFDVSQMNANRVLFVAHREEILDQAEGTFSTLLLDKKTGRFDAIGKDYQADILFASVQSLGKQRNIEGFSKDHFDYIIIDEFHHAAASTYRVVINHFSPKFLLGLTATPDRTDSQDILSLCDGNEIYRRTLYDGIQNRLLSPFTYRGITEHESVNYQEIPWRNGKFDPNELTHKFATVSRAEHNYQSWHKFKQQRTLAFCVSIKHADYMADFFKRKGVRAESLHSKSMMKRSQAINLLKKKELEIIFTVDLFNEGVDIPLVDTILMLRPTESKILFLQQLGRGLRKAEEGGKTYLEIIDFIGNHISFFRKPESLFLIGTSNNDRKQFIRDVKNNELLLADGCFVNYEPEAIDFMRSLISTKPDLQEELFDNLMETLERRPSLKEFFEKSGNIRTIREGYGSWFEFLDSKNLLGSDLARASRGHSKLLRELETSKREKSFKFIHLKALTNAGINKSHPLELLSKESFLLLQNTPFFEIDVPESFRHSGSAQNSQGWRNYWGKNPVAAWAGKKELFEITGNNFRYVQDIMETDVDPLGELLTELIDYRLAEYLSTLDFNDEVPESNNVLHELYLRKDIPPLFSQEFNVAVWNTGHVCPSGSRDQYLFVTIEKSSKQAEHQYDDYFIDESALHWQSQNGTSPESKKGRNIVNHLKNGSNVYLFVRRNPKTANQKGAPFYYCGSVTYQESNGSKTMNVVWRLQHPLPQRLLSEFAVKR